ncbi:hypothetical protein AVEN_157580-1 [Araneus ventricosus]|uniref:Uncharacterized protein n=1 Tax=Araneus ventricosus TaxID=182803 RepID=A0A4Y2Q5M6_ARAVE|nr:hypothetical protein AVEN_157580-1 [Araneus ventricosus]
MSLGGGGHFLFEKIIGYDKRDLLKGAWEIRELIQTPGLLIRQLPRGAAWCGVEVWRGVSAQVSSSSSDRGSKLRGPFQNSPRVASKWDVNIAKPN